jgi:hypothetical protein
LPTLVSCPECGTPAEISRHFWLCSTNGPVAHVALQCTIGHRLLMPADMLATPVLDQLGLSFLAEDGRR